VVQTQSLSTGAFQASLSYLMSGYYYRIRAYYDNSSYIESDKIYVTPDQYFSPNPQYGNTEEDIIEGITYVPNGDGTFNADVHVNLSCVDGQMLQYEWIGTGYCWYDHNNTPHYGSIGMDTNKFTFTLDNLGENLEPGKEWRVKVYLADDYYADWEWQGYSFNYFTDTVPELKEEDKVNYSINWVEAYSSLGGNIAVVFKAELSEDLAKAPNAFMRFTYAGKTVDIPVSEATKSGKYHNFYCRIASINMTDDITAQMMVGEEAIGRSATTSLEKYCQYIIKTSKDAKTLNLMKAMLNYGAAAQKMMNYKLDNLANKSLSEADKKLTKVDASAYKHNLSGSEAGIKASEAMLVLGSETTIRIGFTLTGNKTIDKYTFAVDGVKAEPVLKGGMYRLEVPNIAAHKLDEYHTFTCGDITLTYCGLSYVNQIMKSYTEGTTFDMAVALYNYSQATEAYIG
jgi:hypothetical protein